MTDVAGVQHLTCSCCGCAEVFEGQVGCINCQGDPQEECPAGYREPEPCEPWYLFWDGDEAMCPYCGCTCRVSADEESLYVTHDYETPCPPRVWPW